MAYNNELDAAIGELEVLLDRAKMLSEISDDVGEKTTHISIGRRLRTLKTVAGQYRDLICAAESLENDANAAGHEMGTEEGKEEGHKIGSLEGYDEGHADGHREGYDNGHRDGRNEGYDEGYEEAQKEAELESESAGEATGS